MKRCTKGDRKNEKMDGNVDNFYKGVTSILIRHIKIEITYYYITDEVDGDLLSGLNDYICSRVFHNKSNIKKTSFGKTYLFFSPTPSTHKIMHSIYVFWSFGLRPVDCARIELNIVYSLKISKFHSETYYSTVLCPFVKIPKATDYQI